MTELGPYFDILETSTDAAELAAASDAIKTAVLTQDWSTLTVRGIAPQKRPDQGVIDQFAPNMLWDWMQFIKRNFVTPLNPLNPFG